MILYGVDECRVGKSKIARQAEELEGIVTVLTGLDESLNSGSIKDFYHLGKIKQEFQKPRPILISFIRSTDALKALYKKVHLPSNVWIKPDFTKEERITESVLHRSQ